MNLKNGRKYVPKEFIPWKLNIFICSTWHYLGKQRHICIWILLPADILKNAFAFIIEIDYTEKMKGYQICDSKSHNLGHKSGKATRIFRTVAQVKSMTNRQHCCNPVASVSAMEQLHCESECKKSHTGNASEIMAPIHGVPAIPSGWKTWTWTLLLTVHLVFREYSMKDIQEAKERLWTA